MTRHCATCGHPAKPGDPLRFYKAQRRYPPFHLGMPPGFPPRLPRYEVLWVHRSDLTDPASGLYRAPRLRWLRPIFAAALLVICARAATWRPLAYLQMRAGHPAAAVVYLAWHVYAAFGVLCCAAELAFLGACASARGRAWLAGLADRWSPR